MSQLGAHQAPQGCGFRQVPPGVSAQQGGMQENQITCNKPELKLLLDEMIQPNAEEMPITCQEFNTPATDTGFPQRPPGVFTATGAPQKTTIAEGEFANGQNCMVAYQPVIMPVPVYMPMPSSAEKFSAQPAQRKEQKTNPKSRQGMHKAPPSQEIASLRSMMIELKRSGSNTTCCSTAEGDTSESDERRISSANEDSSDANDVCSPTCEQQEDSQFNDAMEQALQNLESTDADCRKNALQWVSEAFWPLALDRKGCRVVQKATDVGTQAYQQKLAENLQGYVYDALQSPHANYVLQKFVEVVPPERIQFIVDEVSQQVLYIARHRFGCRVLQRLLEHCTPAQTEWMIDKVLSEAAALCRHQYGNFILQHILQYGSLRQRSVIAHVIHEDIMRLSKHRLASHIVSCALVNCSRDDIKMLTEAILQDAGKLYHLSRREYGSFVVREVNRAARMLQDKGTLAVQDGHPESTQIEDVLHWSTAPRM